MSKYITVKEACERYQVTRKTIYNWRKKGLLIEKNKGRSVLLDAKSIEAQLTHKLPNAYTADEGKLTQEIHELKAKIDHLETLISQILHNQCVNVTQEKASTGKVTQTANKLRQEQAIEKARAKFIELGSPDITRAELARQSGVSRDTISKHWVTITQLTIV